MGAKNKNREGGEEKEERGDRLNRRTAKNKRGKGEREEEERGEGPSRARAKDEVIDDEYPKAGNRKNDTSGKSAENTTKFKRQNVVVSKQGGVEGREDGSEKGKWHIGRNGIENGN